MSYQVLARKWRPRNFASLVGQEHVVRALTHALDGGRLHHAYLFTGTRGVGKTTLARILARSLNCERGVSATPCGECGACREIDAGRFVDLLEVDAATNTRVDEMRQLLENAVYAPTRGRFKVYVIDEVHMLSTSAFNAMLKTLEEPPEHVKFILATTDPQKIPVTVLSRCLQFNLKQMSAAEIRGHLERILAAESIDAERGALALIAQAARGSMRDALSLLDQAIAYAGGRVPEAEVRAMLGSVDRGYLFDILEALAGGDLRSAVAVAEQMAARSLSFGAGLQEIAAILQRVALAQADADILPRDLDDRDRIIALSALLDAETVQLYYTIALHGREELALAPDEHAGFTMTLLRMAAFRPESSSGEGVTRRATLASATAALPKRASATSAPAAATGAPIVPGAAATASPTSVAGAVDTAALDDWPRLVRALKLSGFTKQLAERSELVSRSGMRFEIGLPPVAKQLAEYRDKLRAAMESALGARVALEVVIREVAGPTVAAEDQARQADAERSARARIDGDPFVQALVADMGATIESVKPIN
jgi:DNA polymerase III subunit gamma/tau